MRNRSSGALRADPVCQGCEQHRFLFHELLLKIRIRGLRDLLDKPVDQSDLTLRIFLIFEQAAKPFLRDFRHIGRQNLRRLRRVDNGLLRLLGLLIFFQFLPDLAVHYLFIQAGF